MRTKREHKVDETYVTGFLLKNVSFYRELEDIKDEFIDRFDGVMTTHCNDGKPRYLDVTIEIEEARDIDNYMDLSKYKVDTKRVITTSVYKELYLPLLEKAMESAIKHLKTIERSDFCLKIMDLCLKEMTSPNPDAIMHQGDIHNFVGNIQRDCSLILLVEDYYNHPYKYVTRIASEVAAYRICLTNAWMKEYPEDYMIDDDGYGYCRDYDLIHKY